MKNIGFFYPLQNISVGTTYSYTIDTLFKTYREKKSNINGNNGGILSLLCFENICHKCNLIKSSSGNGGVYILC